LSMALHHLVPHRICPSNHHHHRHEVKRRHHQQAAEGAPRTAAQVPQLVILTSGISLPIHVKASNLMHAIALLSIATFF
jgi:hypothetical protein